MHVIAVVLLSITTVIAAAPNETGKTPSPPAKSPAPISKYQREQLDKYRNSAPADQYFGRMKLSFLGINNTFRDAAISAGDRTVDPSIVSKVAFADDALQDWARRFPRDPQLARSYYLAIRAEQKVWLKPNQERTWNYMNRIVATFPTSYFAKAIKKNIAIGFTEHYYADPVPCATPEPVRTVAASPTPAVVTSEPPRGRSRSTATPRPTATPTPEPTATPTPVATPISRPSPVAIAKGLKLQIETPPCVEPPAPTPSPSPSPSPSAAPSAMPAPAPAASPAPPTRSVPPSPRP